MGLIGNEGMTGTVIIQGGVRSPFHTYMQSAGSGIRVDATVLRSALQDSGHLRQLLGSYVLAFSMQLASTAAANGLGLLEQRTARWLLMVADRVGSRFSITHELLALMLASHRPGVTLALQALEGKGLIQSQRGVLVIVDRDGLVLLTEGIYGMAEREYRFLLPETSRIEASGA